MGPLRVVLDPPRFDRLPHLLQRRDPVLIQALVPQPTIERLGNGIVRRFAGARERQLQPVALGPGIEGLGNELRAVVDSDPLGASTGSPAPFQHRHHPLAGHRAPDLDGGAHGIDYRQESESLPVGQAIGQDIQAPPLLRAVRRWWQHPCSAHRFLRRLARSAAIRSSSFCRVYQACHEAISNGESRAHKKRGCGMPSLALRANSQLV